MQNLGFVSQVEYVTIELGAGFNGIELKRYILEHAESLEKMVIRYLAKQSNDVGKLKECKMISNPSVTFEEYEFENRPNSATLGFVLLPESTLTPSNSSCWVHQWWFGEIEVKV
ncbi:hypothetical protein ACLB2K_063642 [Fragaria x ananassa]